MNIKKLFSKELLSHLVIIGMVIVFVICNNYCLTDKTILSYEEKSDEMAYLDPVETAFSVEKISNYTPNITENLPALEESLFFSQPKSNEYLDKKIITNNFATQQSQLEREYVVQDGDTISQVAERYGMHVGTLYERNGLSADNIENIRPGDTIIIPAHDTSDSQQWLADLNYKKEEERQRLLALEQEREKERQLAAAEAARSVYTRSSASSTTSATNYSGSQTTSPNTSGYNGYPYGWCTYYAASKRNIPSNWGNAGQWISSAQNQGYSTGSTPTPGALIVTGESWYGHVGYVESVNPDGSANISEMNYNGWGTVSTRTINAGNPVVKGYIY